MNVAKARHYLGWFLTSALGLLFVASAVAKLMRAAPVVKSFGEWGLADRIALIGIGELVSAVLFMAPRVHPLGVLLLSSYMGGAIVTHMEHGEPFGVQSVILVLIWVAAFVRRPAVLIDPPSKLRPLDF